jgi:hypothetical protein
MKKSAAATCRDTTNIAIIRYWGSQELENLSAENLSALGWGHGQLEKMKGRLKTKGIDESRHADVIDG